jgi:ubiquinol-cytochrome c reductase cytochrome c1 subunit
MSGLFRYIYGQTVQSLTKSNLIWGIGGALTAAAVSTTEANPLSLASTANASSDELQPPHYPWSHRFPWQSFDHASIRRGFSVYKQVCATCHSLDRIAYRNLVDSCYTTDEVKEIAADVDIVDGPNEEGEMFERPGRLSDYFPKPYANENAARFANNGAYPPDLSLIVKGRTRHEDYVFSILTGYRDSPHGINLRQGLYYNPYFPGGAIAMPQALIDGAIEFEDGTKGSISQMSKDVSTFLAWAAEPESDERKRMGIKAAILLVFSAIPTYYFKRQRWNLVKSRVISFKNK